MKHTSASTLSLAFTLLVGVTAAGCENFELAAQVPDADDFSGPPDALVEDAKGRLWLLANQRLFTVRGDLVGTLWLGSGAGGFGRVRNFEYEPLSLPGFGDVPRVRALAPDGHGGAWVAIRDQPVLIRFTGDTLAGIYGPSSGITEPLQSLAAEGVDTLWATTASGTLVRIIRGTADRMAEPGLRAVLTSGPAVLIPAHPHLWIGSPGGIGRVALPDLHAWADGEASPPKTHWYGPGDGLKVAQTNRHDTTLGVRAPDGRIWFTTPAGLAVVDPGSIPVNTKAPTPVIEGVWVTGRDAEVADGGSVAANPQRIEVAFTAGSLRMTECVAVEYRLDGADDDWVPAGASRVAAYTRLRHGRYRFRVRARNEDGVPSMAEATFGFRVLPAWYQTWWFMSLAVLGIAGAGAGMVGAWAYASARASRRLLHERYQVTLAERTRMAQELHDTLLQGFLGVTLHLHSLHNLLGNSHTEAAEALDRVLELADHALREGRESVWDIRPPELDEVDLPRAVEFAARRGVGDLPIVVTVDTVGTCRKLPRDLETTVLRVSREAVANAVRHGRPRTIAVMLAYEEGNVLLRVQDDGAGFEPTGVSIAADNGHWGLRGMHERARNVGGAVQVHSAAGTGTCVELRLPSPPAST